MCLLQKKRNHSANEACENMTKNSRNNTEKSYSTTENGMPEGLKFDAAKKRNLSANEACENLTKNSRNNTEKSYFYNREWNARGFKLMHFYHLLKTYQLTHETLTYQSVLSLIPLFKIHKTHQLKVAVFTQIKRMMMLFNKPLTSRFQTMRMILTMKQHALKNFISKNHLGKI